MAIPQPHIQFLAAKSLIPMITMATVFLDILWETIVKVISMPEICPVSLSCDNYLVSLTSRKDLIVRTLEKVLNSSTHQCCVALPSCCRGGVSFCL